MKKYKFTILLLLTFVIAFPVITVKLVTAEQEKKARQEELAKVTDTEKEPADRRCGALAKPTRQTPIRMRGMCQFAQTGSKKILVLCKTDTLQGQSVVV